MFNQLIKRKIKSWIYRFNIDKDGKNIVYLCLLLIIFTTLYCIGIIDHFIAKDFREFKWPPYIDVREQVVRELIGEYSQYSHLNNWDDYEFALEPNCKYNHLTRKKSLLIVVKTGPDRLQNRDAIRTTWGKITEFNNWKIQTIFVMGLMDKKKIEKYGDVIHAEHKQFNDLIVGKFIDSYRNNTLKFIHSLKYAYNRCNTGTVPYVLLIDDDYMVNMNNLIIELNKHPPNEHLYMGWRFDTSPFRLIFHKHRVSLSSYPFNRYPPYISAGAVLMTSQTIKEFYLAIQYTKLFPFDDIYASILAYHLGILPQHNENFKFWQGTPGNESPTTIVAHGYSPNDLIKHNINL